MTINLVRSQVVSSKLQTRADLYGKAVEFGLSLLVAGYFWFTDNYQVTRKRRD